MSWIVCASLCKMIYRRRANYFLFLCQPLSSLGFPVSCVLNNRSCLFISSLINQCLQYILKIQYQFLHPLLQSHCTGFYPLNSILYVLFYFSWITTMLECYWVKKKRVVLFEKYEVYHRLTINILVYYIINYAK